MRRSDFEIHDEKIIDGVLATCEYGTLALSVEDKPYSLPINYVHEDNVIYFHGSLKGRKMEMLRANPHVSFSVVENYSVIQSYFSSTEGLACPATQFFKSVVIEGRIVIVEDFAEKIHALTLLMQKLQSEGGYKPFSDEAYKKMIDATAIFRLDVSERKAKFKFGQHLNQERFDMILKSLEERNSDLDSATIAMMREFRKQ